MTFLPRWFPKPASWASAVALFFYGGAVSMAMAAAMPFIADLMRRSPRLGWVAVLAIWLAPIGGASILHHTTHKVLDAADKDKVASGVASAWAGFVAWATILLVTMTTGFVMLVIDPPPVDPDTLAALALRNLGAWHGVVHAAVWIALAASVHSLERAARRH